MTSGCKAPWDPCNLHASSSHITPPSEIQIWSRGSNSFPIPLRARYVMRKLHRAAETSVPGTPATYTWNIQHITSGAECRFQHQWRNALLSFCCLVDSCDVIQAQVAMLTFQVRGESCNRPRLLGYPGTIATYTLTRTLYLPNRCFLCEWIHVISKYLTILVRLSPKVAFRSNIL